MKNYDVCIVGASGLIGRTLLDIIAKSDISIGRLDLFCGKNSENKYIKFRNKRYRLKRFQGNFSNNYDFIFFTVKTELSLIFYNSAINHCRFLIDNSSAFRQKKNVPLIVPCVNGNKLYGKLVANPNCVAAICAPILSLLDNRYALKHVDITTYQAISGCGQRSLDLFYQKKARSFLLDDSIFKNCTPAIGEIAANGYSEEENKISFELKKILKLNRNIITATCVRVPITNCHSASLSVELKTSYRLDDVKELLLNCPNVIYYDNTFESLPTAQKANGNDKIHVGRLRRNPNRKNSLQLFITSDNLRQGAAYNAFAIMKHIVDNES